MSDRYQNDQACGIEPEREGDGPTLEQWRSRCRYLWKENLRQRAALGRIKELQFSECDEPLDDAISIATKALD